MKVISIEENGSNNILKWALSKNVEIKKNQTLIDFINYDLHYVVTLDQVNLFELNQLSTIFRNELRVLEVHQAAVPDRQTLLEKFPGKVKIEDTEYDAADVALEVINKFNSIALQMLADSDVIELSTTRLFIPMINRTFKVRIPISFKELMIYISEEDASKLFNENYPKTLNNIHSLSSLKAMIEMNFIKDTSVVNYTETIEKYLKVFRYFPLSKEENYYEAGLLSLNGKNKVNKQLLISLNLFKSTPEDVSKAMRLFKNAESINYEFTVQLPLEYQWVLNTEFDPSVLEITSVSSITDIMSSGLQLNKILEKGKSEGIDSYRVRLQEANQFMINSIAILLSNKVNSTSVFSLLPSIYKFKSVLSFNTDNLNQLKSIDDVITGLFNNMKSIVNGIDMDIKKS